jgi:hypothetical protein
MLRYSVATSVSPPPLFFQPKAETLSSHSVQSMKRFYSLSDTETYSK